MHHSNLVVLLSSLIRQNMFKNTKDRCIQNIKSMTNCLGLVGMFLILRSADVLKPCGGSSQTWDNSIWLCLRRCTTHPAGDQIACCTLFLYLHEDWVYGFDQNLGKPKIIGIPVTQISSRILEVSSESPNFGRTTEKHQKILLSIGTFQP